MIASWRMDLNRIVLIFNVSSVASTLLALIVHTQTELGLNIYVAVSDVGDNVTRAYTIATDTHTAVTEVQRDFAGTNLVVANTHTMVSDIHRQMLGGREGADDQRQLVSNVQTVPTTEYVLTVSQTQTR